MFKILNLTYQIFKILNQTSTKIIIEKLLRQSIKTNRFNESNLGIFNKYLMLKIFNILNYILKKINQNYLERID